MTYQVEFSLRAELDLESLFLEKNVAESEAAARWILRLQSSIARLETNPHRCPLAPETAEAKRELRHLLYGKKPHIYRVIYEVDERRQTVWLLTIRHGAREPLPHSELE